MSKDAEETRKSGLSRRTKVLLVVAAVLTLAAWRLRRPGPQPAAPANPAPAMPTRLEPEALSKADSEREAVPVTETYRREVTRPRPVQNPSSVAVPEEAPTPLAGGPLNRKRDEKRTLPEIFRMPADPPRVPTPAPEPAPKPSAARPALSESFAPFGRLIKCQLVGTLDSITARSEPIVALVTEPLYWNGQLIIPAGAEAYGYARPEPILDTAGIGRLVDDGQWTLVLPAQADAINGRELVLRARAIDRRENVVTERGTVRSWGPDDGADGLVGYTASSMDNAELRLFAAAALTGLAQGAAAVAQRQQPATGLPGALGATQAAPTLGNAVTASLSAGSTDVLGEWVSRIRQEIARRGAYVRVPAGKTFYLFVEQTIDPRQARVGQRLPSEKGAQP